MHLGLIFGKKIKKNQTIFYYNLVDIRVKIAPNMQQIKKISQKLCL